MRKILIIAIAVLFTCGTAYAQVNDGIDRPRSEVFTWGFQAQQSGGYTDQGYWNGASGDWAYAYVDEIGGWGGQVDIPGDLYDMMDWELEFPRLHNDFLQRVENGNIDGQISFLRGVALPDSNYFDEQTDAAAGYYSQQAQAQFNIAHIGSESVHAEAYMGQYQEVEGAAYNNGIARSFAFAATDPLYDIGAEAETVGLGDPINAGFAETWMDIDPEEGWNDYMMVGAGTKAANVGVWEPELVWDEEAEQWIGGYVEGDWAYAYSEAWAGSYASYTNTVCTDTFWSFNTGWAQSDFTMWAESMSAGTEIDPSARPDQHEAYIWNPDVSAYSEGGIAIQADSDTMYMAGGTEMFAGMWDAEWYTTGNTADANGAGGGSAVGMNIHQSSYYWGEAAKTTCTGYQTAFQEFSAWQDVSFTAKNGSINYNTFPPPIGPENNP